MSRDKEYQVREGRHIATRESLALRLRRGVKKIFLERGVPNKGTGRYSIRNAQAAEAIEKRLQKGGG